MKDSAIAPHAISDGMNQKLERSRSQYLSSQVFTMQLAIQVERSPDIVSQFQY